MTINNRRVKDGLWVIGLTGLLVLTLSPARASDPDVTAATRQCMSCHDFGPKAPVHNVMAGSHGISVDDEDAGNRRGCADCHGDSTGHRAAPTNVAPEVSFGPRWSASTAAQDGQCLNCHEQDTARHWKDALHMVNNLACATCHDIHAPRDRVLFPETQAEVCTVCHKVQKKGIHGMEQLITQNPSCTACHNPHDHESAAGKMLENQSAGCSQCHDLSSMANSADVSTGAKRSHRAMTRPGRTCLDCHEGVAHAPTDAAPPLHTVASRSKQVTLFYPGIADSEWLLQAHPGSQPLRQGASCQRCHRGEEAELGLARAGQFEPTHRPIDLTFSTEDEQLVITLEWQGSPEDASISLMWGDERNEAFRRGGCFAACHSDLPGMSRDTGQEIGKYLQVSRSQRQSIGQPSITWDEKHLASLMRAGKLAELWQIDLGSATLQRALLLDDVHWQTEKLTWIKKTFNKGRWSLVLRRQMNNTGDGVSFTAGGKYTFGVALNSTSNPGGEHWISLPMTLSFGRDDTDFTAE